MGYADIDFYLPVYHNIILLYNYMSVNNANKNSGDFIKSKLPSLKLRDLGYLMQNLPLFNFNDEYIINYFMNKFVRLFNRSLGYNNLTNKDKNLIDHF